MSDHVEDAPIIELLGPLHRLEPVTLRTRLERGRAWRPLLVVFVVVAALAGVGVAIADGFGAFDGISAAERPPSAADVIDPATQAYMEGGSSMPIIGGLLFNTARVVGRLPSGQNIYVITTKSNSLCFVVGPPHPEWNCDDPLTRSHPSTVFLYGQDPNTTPPTFGIAVDGVTAVSFEVDGREMTLPVKNNVWIYQGPASRDVFYSAMVSLTAHFADGTTVVQTH